MRIQDMDSDFDAEKANKSNETKEFEPLPEGKYACRIDRVKAAPTKDGGERLSVGFVVTEGAHAKRLIWHHFWFSGTDGQKRFNMRKYHEMLNALGYDKQGRPQSGKGRPIQNTEDVRDCKRVITIVLGMDKPYKNRDGVLVEAEEPTVQWFNKRNTESREAKTDDDTRVQRAEEAGYATSASEMTPNFDKGSEELPF